MKKLFAFVLGLLLYFCPLAVQAQAPGAGAGTVAEQQKRKAVNGGTHRRSKRARRGKLTGGMRVEDT